MNGKTGRGAVLITGTSTGIGRETACHLDRLGFQVFASVRNERDASALEATTSARLQAVLMDVTDETSIAAARQMIGQAIAGNRLVGLVNNAGIGLSAPLEFVPLDEVRRLFDVNVFGLLAVTQAFLPLLRQARGRIVNVSSAASLLPSPFMGTYSASKLSLNGLSNALRLELRPFGISVSVVICGSFRTAIWDKGPASALRVLQRMPPQARELYGDAWQKVGANVSQIGKRGQSPLAAARTIARALTAKRARLTYLAGPDAHLFNALNKTLFGRLRDWVIMRTIGV